MFTARTPTSYDQLLDKFVHLLSPEEILAFQLTEEEQDRIDDLLERNSEGQLTMEEKAELQQYAEIERTVSLLKAKAAYILNQK
jgi:hypothetical protein